MTLWRKISPWSTLYAWYCQNSDNISRQHVPSERAVYVILYPKHDIQQSVHCDQHEVHGVHESKQNVHNDLHLRDQLTQLPPIDEVGCKHVDEVHDGSPDLRQTGIHDQHMLDRAFFLVLDNVPEGVWTERVYENDENTENDVDENPFQSQGSIFFY